MRVADAVLLERAAVDPRAPDVFHRMTPTETRRVEHLRRHANLAPGLEVLILVLEVERRA